MNKEAWRAAVHGVAESRTQLSNGTELNWTEQLVQSSLLLIIAIKIEKFSFFWEILNWDFPSDPVVKTQKVNFHLSEAQVQTLVGRITVACCMLWAKKKKKKYWFSWTSNIIKLDGSYI